MQPYISSPAGSSVNPDHPASSAIHLQCGTVNAAFIELSCSAHQPCRITRVSPEVQDLWGLAPDALMADPSLAWGIAHPDDRPAVQSLFAGGTVCLRYRILHPLHGLRAILAMSTPYGGQAADQPRQASIVAIDITAEQQNTRTRQFDRDLLNCIIQTSVTAITVLNPQGEIILANPAAEGILGLTRGELQGRMYNAPAWKHTDLQGNVLLDEQMPFAIVRRTLQPIRGFEHAIAWPDGTRRILSINGEPILDEAGQLVLLVFCVEDITERKLNELSLRDSEARFRRLARHDALTGLPNRSAILQELEAAIEGQGISQPEPFALLLINVDLLRRINDVRGQPAGDRILQLVSDRLRSLLAATDTLGRTAGDEFVLIRRKAPSARHVEALADAIHAVMAQPFDLDSHLVDLTVCIGLVLVQGPPNAAGSLLADAAIALGRAKARGRGETTIFRPSMREAVQRAAIIESQLARAISQNELSLAWQPIVDLEQLRIIACEALLRWVRLERGYIGPAEFLPIAEKSRLVLSLGEWVLQRAISDLAHWRTSSPAARTVNAAINISRRQLNGTNLLHQIRRHLAAAGLEPADLILEITESSSMPADTHTAELLQAIRAEGVRLFLDDFGVGYSSLSHLHLIPISALKIDRSFVARIETDASAASMVRGIVRMAEALDLQVIAEGVESALQASLLHRMGVRRMQGYYFCPPLSAAEIAERLRSGGLVSPGAWIST